jgi:hypothetical protein
LGIYNAIDDDDDDEHLQEIMQFALNQTWLEDHPFLFNDFPSKNNRHFPLATWIELEGTFKFR